MNMYIQTIENIKSTQLFVNLFLNVKMFLIIPIYTENNMEIIKELL